MPAKNKPVAKSNRTRRLPTARARRSLRLGDYVRVRAGVIDPDFEDLVIGGWTGRVWGIGRDRRDDVICDVKWDQATLGKMSPKFRKRSTGAGLDFRSMDLPEDDLVRVAGPRTVVDPKLSTSDHGDRIREVFGLSAAHAVPKVTPDAILTYYFYLQKHISCPFEACHRDRWSPRRELANPVTVEGLLAPAEASDLCLLYGVICLTTGPSSFWTHEVPLSELEMIESSPQYQLVHDYAVWFGSRKPRSR